MKTTDMASPAGRFTVATGFVVGASAVIPSGTVVRTTRHRQLHRVTRRAHTVSLTGVYNGWVDTVDQLGQGRGFVQLPRVEWVGSAGYWQRAQVTAELLAANAMPQLVIPGADGGDLDDCQLDVLPSTEVGYCDRWPVPADAVT